MGMAHRQPIQEKKIGIKIIIQPLTISRQSWKQADGTDRSKPQSLLSL